MTIYPHLATTKERMSLDLEDGLPVRQGRSNGPRSFYENTSDNNVVTRTAFLRATVEPMPKESQGLQRCEGLTWKRKRCRVKGTLANGLCIKCWDTRCGTIACGNKRSRSMAIELITGLAEIPKRRGPNKLKAA